MLLLLATAAVTSAKETISVASYGARAAVTTATKPETSYGARAAVTTAKETISVASYGARCDGATEDTAAFEAALAHAGAHAHTTILVPPARCLIAPINLTSHTTLRIAANATVAGVADAARWPLIPGAPSYGQGRDHPGPRYTSLVHGEHVEDVTIQGEGPTSVLDGNGQYWWDQVHSMTVTRGHLIEFMYSKDIRIYDLSMRDSPFWNNHFTTAKRPRSGTSTSPPRTTSQHRRLGPRQRARRARRTQHVRRRRRRAAIKSGWDCFGVAYGKPSRNITIRDVNCTGSKAGIAIGSEMSGGVEDVLVQRVNILGKANGIAHVKTGPTRGGYVRNVRFEDMTADGAALEDAILVDGHYKSPNPSCPASWNATLPATANVSFVRIDARDAACSQHAVRLTGQDGAPIAGVYLEDVHVGTGDWECAAVSGAAKIGTVQPWPPCGAIAPVS
ncbi:glycosyl hydrolase [Aureococcus anophagefferens]|nr:glycosyl hydrolase [Aureococcus anophagefferens]